MTHNRGPALDGLAVSGTLDEGAAAEIAALRRDVEDLHDAMESGAVIEQAKGMLMARYGIPEDRAFTLLVGWSSSHDVELRVTAMALVSAAVSNHALAGQDVGPERLLQEALWRVRSAVHAF